MGKWIAEFELEDGDTMPEHMDLEYKGARIDFHCKQLEQEPCEDAIDRKYLTGRMFTEADLSDAHTCYESIRKIVEEMPSVTPIRPKGHWDKKDLGHVECSAICSECGEWTYWSERGNYCPNCGAKMIEPQESEDNL